MTVVRPTVRTGLIATVLLAAGCPAPPADLPEPPVIDTAGMIPAVAEALSQAEARVRRRPHSAARNGRMAMLLHAHRRPLAASVYYRRARMLAPRAFDWAYLHGLAAEEGGRPREALEGFERAVALDPDYVPALLKLGGFLLRDGRIDEAGVHYRRALALAPERADVQLGLGRWLLQNDEPEAALEPLERALAIAGDVGSVHFALASAYRRLGDTAAAARHQAQFERLKEHKLRVFDPVRAQMLALDASDRPHVLRAQGHVLAGEDAAAIAAFEQAAAINPARVATHSNLIVLYGKRGDLARVREHYEQAVAVEPDNARLHFNTGNALMAANLFDEAEAMFRRAVELDPDLADAQAQLGDVLERRGDRYGAVAAYRRALASEPAHRQASFLLGRQLAFDGEYDQAVAHIERTLEPVDKMTPVFLRGLAGIHLARGDRDAARATFERALELAYRVDAPGPLIAQIERDLAALRNQSP